MPIIFQKTNIILLLIKKNVSIYCYAIRTQLNKLLAHGPVHSLA